MLVGVDWVFEQNDDPVSEMYQRIDTTHVGATGHSQGGFGTSEIGTDSRIKTTAPICGAIGSSNLQGPALLLCGGQDTNVPCNSTIQSAFDGTRNQPVMLANHLASNHANWITVFGTGLSEVEVAVTAWMRLHLMDDTELHSWFYGASCQLCQETSTWQVSRKLMDE
jgi:hypothetical protein